MTDDTGAVEATAPTSDYAATLWAEKPEAPSKLMAVLLILLVKLILAIPHIVAVSLIQGAAQSIAWLAWWVVLITGRMPPLFADLMVASLRWNWRAIAWLYGIADDYPPFAPEAEGYPADVDCMLIENPHRGLALARILIFPILIMLIPHFLVLFFLNILAMLVLLITPWAVIFTGRYPDFSMEILVGVQRWTHRVSCYSFGLVDEYPPFRMGH